MQSYLCIGGNGGNHDGLSFSVAPDLDIVELPVGVTDRETYIRSSLAVGAVFATFYKHENLTPEQVLDRIVESYKAWRVNRPGGRR